MGVSIWKLVLSIFGSTLLILPQARSALYVQEPIPLSRCERSIPVFKLIPAAVTKTGQIIPLQPIQLRRATRQHQSPVVQQLLVNQNTASQLHTSFGGFGGDGLRTFISGRRPYDGFDQFVRSYGGEAESAARPCSSSSPQIEPAPPCASSYLLSCSLNLTPTSCTNEHPCLSY